MTYLGVDAIVKGDPDILLNGIDYKGRVCGVDDAVKDKPELYYIRFDGTGVCVESCPNATNWSALWACTDDDSDFTTQEGYDCGGDPTVCLAKADLSATGKGGGSFEGNGKGTCMFQVESIEFVGRCVYTDTDVLGNFVDVGGEVDYLQEAASDVYKARRWIFGFGFVFATVLGFVYLAILQLPGFVWFMVWGSIAIVLLILLGMGYGLLKLASMWEDDGEHTDVQVLGCEAVGYLAYGCATLFACLIVYLRKQISLAMAIVKESASAIGSIKIMIFMPLLQCVAIAVFLVPWVIYAVYTASLAEITTTTIAGMSVRDFEYSDEVEKRGWYLLFVFFWTTQFIVAMGQIVVSLTVVKYYFTRDVQTVGTGTFCKSLQEGLTYHVGTAAFGSLIIAVIKMIRTVLTYIQKRLETSHNRVARAILCCMQCFFWCLEKCVKFINKNAYVQVAIFSTSFCQSAKNAFWLIARNLGRVGAVTVVTDFVSFIMKLVISLGSAGATYVFLLNFMEDELYSPVGPVLFVGVMAFFVADSFVGLLGMASISSPPPTTLTILQCFIADEEMFSPGERYARTDLKEWLHKHGGRNDRGGPGASRSGPNSPPPRSPLKRGGAAETGTT
ncbi:unnamed protein product [Ascophyllum nodosum]